MPPSDRLAELQAEFGNTPLCPITLTVSPGRCGTVFLQKLFTKTFGDSGEFLHERLSAHEGRSALFFRAYDPQLQSEMLQFDAIYEEFRRLLEAARTRPICEFGHYFISAVPAMQAIAPQALRVLAVHRHPLQSAASHAIKGHYVTNKSRMWAITPTHERVFHPEYVGRWEQMTAYEKELYRWLQITKYALELPKKIPGLKWKVVASRDLFKSTAVQADIAEFCGFPRPTFSSDTVSKNESTDFNRETMPIGDEWQRTGSYPEIVQLAESLGYDMTPENLKTLIAPYQAPSGLGAALRRWSGYWYVRKWLGMLRAPAEES